MKISNLSYNLQKDKKYILTCSYGPDSMALFRYLVDNGYDFVVAHVNYHILEQADDDLRKILDICKVFSKKVYVLDIHMPEGVNEEDWARKVRYSWFDDLAKRLGIPDVLVAHNKNDLIETYIMQKDKGQHLHFGIQNFIHLEYCNIVRPLLNYSKNQLLEYCKETNTDYSIDPSNFDSKFKRNAIRLKMKDYSENDLDTLFAVINHYNEQNNKVLNKYLKYFDDVLGFDFASAHKDGLNQLEFHICLLYYIEKEGVSCELGRGRAEAIYHKLMHHKKNSTDYLSEDTWFFYEYGFIKIGRKHSSYCFDIEEINSIFNVNINELEYNADKSKFSIKNAISADFLLKNNEKLAVNRLFISMKLPLSLRDVRPGIFDEKGNLIYVPRYQRHPRENGVLQFSLENLEKNMRVICKKQNYALYYKAVEKSYY